MGMGYLPYWMMYQCLMATFLFYLAHWQTYVTGEYCFKLIIIREKKSYINICCWNYTTVHWYSSMQKWWKSTSWPLDTISYTQWSIYLKENWKDLGNKSFLFPLIVLLACMQIQKSITIVLATYGAEWRKTCNYFH